MPNIASALKAEIARVARKELRAEMEPLKKSAAMYRREIAALKRRIQQLEQRQKANAKSGARVPNPMRQAGDEEANSPKLRFSATRFAAQRKKLGLSAAKFAKLLGVSSLSVYKWESGQTRPRRAQLEAIAAARSLGKKEAAARLGS